jgi:hypothetical protein
MLTNGNVKMSYTWGGLQVAQYKDKDIAPLFPLLEQEFSNWTPKKISSYMDLVTTKANDTGGVLVAQNEALYYVGLVVYTLQQIKSEHFNCFTDSERKGKVLNEVYDILVIENIIASSPVLQKQVFMALVEATVKIAKHLSCDYVELPKVDHESFQFVRKKYGPQIEDAKGFRSYITLSSSPNNPSPLG